jgi:hypothetical protein
MKYEIYQLDGRDKNNHGKIFMPWRIVKDEFSITDYKMIYTGDIDTGNDIIETLDELFEIFNMRHPEDFHGHSLSVSDVIQINDRLYYCDSCGWVEL